MIAFGKTLRETREAKGYTLRQLADQTKISPSAIEKLEAEDITNLPAPIYVRGHLKLCAQALGLDPQLLVESYMATINGERPAEPTSAADTPSPSPVSAEPPPAPTSSADPIPEAPALESAEVPNEPLFSRYAAPLSTTTEKDPMDALRYGRLLAVALIAVLLVVGIVLGIRALYRATTPASEATTAPDATTPAATAPAATPTTPTPRTQQKIPSLYLNS